MADGLKQQPLAQVKDENVSDLPYHNKQTEAIQAAIQKVLDDASAEAAKEAELKQLAELKAKYPEPAETPKV